MSTKQHHLDFHSNEYRKFSAFYEFSATNNITLVATGYHFTGPLVFAPHPFEYFAKYMKIFYTSDEILSILYCVFQTK